MASATIGALRIILGADTAKFQKAMDGVQGRMQRLGRDMQRIGKDLTRNITLPVGLAGAGILKVAGDFEASMNRVGALTGATGGKLDELRESAKAMGIATQFSASQAADALSFLAMAGFSADEAMAALPGTLQLAAAAQMDLGRSADIVSNVLTGYQMTAEDLARVNDVLVKTFTSTNTNLEQLGEAMTYAAPVAASAGIAFEEASAAIGMMGNAGIQASMAGTSLRGAITRILAPTKEAQLVMRELGLEFTDAQGRLIPLDKVVQQLEPHAENTAAMMELFGQRAGPAMAALVSQGSESMRELTAELENSGGVAQRIADQQMAGFNGEMKKLKSAFEGLLIAIADSGLLEAMTSFITKLTEGLRWLSETNPTVLKLGTAFAAVAAVLGPLVVTLGLISAGIAAISAPVLAVTGAVVGLTAAFVAFGGELTKILPKLETIKAAVGDMTAGVAQHMNDSSFIGSFKRANGAVGLTMNAFESLYTAVVGNSYIPDMVEGVESWMGRLARNMPKQAKSATEQTAQQFHMLEDTAIRVGDNLASSMSSAVSGFLDGTTSIKGAINDISTSLRDMLTQRIFQSLLGGFTIPGFAEGTNYAPGGVAMVGERGPELVNLPRGSQVIPNDQIGGGTTLKNINVFDPSIVGDFLTSNQGEEVMMNFLTARGITGNA